MSSIPKRSLRTGVELSTLGFGGAPLGELFDPVSETEAQETLQAAWDAGIRYYDTAPFYGYGKSEHRLGHFLRQQERKDFILSSKVGRVLTATRDLDSFDKGGWIGGLPFDYRFDYSYDGIMRSWEDSLQRLGLSSIDVLLIHDLDSFFHDSEQRFSAHLNQLITSGWRALDELRSQGLIKAVGTGLNRMGALPRLIDAVDLDLSIVAMPYTLLDQEVLEEEFPLCEEHGVRIVIGAVFASGILVSGPTEGARYAYNTASPEILDKTRRIQEVCQRHDVPLPAAAMQFPLGHPLVSAIIPGAMEPSHIQTNAKWFQHEIPADMWAELKTEGLLREDAPTP
ncbi:MAG: aldo/keto reductase [Gemmatimonadetes bacterium]|jgi:D-threo-aldose 1-dehydrogenase|nr:aldo/keto reductase [Gemmatimonadota bacterium]MBT6621075.1 aldo/keto reductase [Gemmatimonadota bacterium]MBT6906177.1 aldo/keto reductase [Gemmatimonadota bacterium]MBT7418914.1 aldo/keto reductase [Gemmatimonadota bacterium]MBT7547369.1 aldo/keto reductase [Gemmatimonadota bacterium]